MYIITIALHFFDLVPVGSVSQPFTFTGLSQFTALHADKGSDTPSFPDQVLSGLGMGFGNVAVRFKVWIV